MVSNLHSVYTIISQSMIKPSTFTDIKTFKKLLKFRNVPYGNSYHVKVVQTTLLLF